VRVRKVGYFGNTSHRRAIRCDLTAWLRFCRLVSGHIERQLLLILSTLQEVADVAKRAAVDVRKDRADEGEDYALYDLLSVRLAMHIYRSVQIMPLMLQ
jgi:hypothetical protein